MVEYFSKDELRRRIGELEREAEELRRNLSGERAARRALEAGQVDAVLDRAGGGALLLQAAQAALQASEERYRTIVSTAEEGIWTVDADMVTTFVNERLASMLGYTVEEVIGRSLEDFIDASGREATRQGFERRRQGIRERRDVALRRKDGTVLWASVAASPLVDPDGCFAGSLAMVTDITERRQAEEAQARLAAIVEGSEDAIFAKSLDGTILTWNAGAEALFGYTAAEAIGRSVELLTPPERRAELSDMFDRLRSGEAVSHLETVRRRKDGAAVFVFLSVSLLRDGDGRVVGASTIARDVTERRRSEEARQQLERRFRLMVEHSADGIALFTADGVFTYVSPSAERILGRREEELLGHHGLEHVHPDDVPKLVEIAAGLGAEPGSVYRIEFRYGLPDGTVHWIENSSVNRLDEAGIEAVVATFRDVTERRRLEEERRRSSERLRESEERYRVLFDESPMPMWAYDPESLQIVMANQAAAEQYGYTTDELETLALPDIRPSEVDAEGIRAVNRTMPPGRQHTGIWEHRRKDGSLLDVDVHLNDVQLGGRRLKLAVLHDVTHRRSLEEQLRQAQKMEAVGRLAGGVAHDFNNLLTAILGYSDLLASRFRVGDPERADIQEIRRAGERAAALTRQLLAFSRKQVLVPEALDLGSVLRGLSRLLERLIGEDITVRLVVAPDLGAVLADPGQMEQVVMNLAVNARDAMPRGGELLLEIRNVDLDEAYAGEHLGATPGPHVLLAVSDTGVGMAHEVQKHIFEPFFTTKPSGEGTGLGLSTVHGIVNQSGGTIWVYSEPGRGTTFKIYLPRIAGAAAVPPPPSESLGPVEGSGTILLVEDEEQLRHLARRILELSGYSVLEAGSPADALRIARAHDGPIHLLLTDVVMPGMSGPEVAASLLRERPGVPILYMSGYTDDAIVHHGLLKSGTQFLQKPFTPHRLAQRVHEVMRGTR